MIRLKKLRYEHSNIVGSIALSVFGILDSTTVHAQATTVLDPSPFTTTRASSMGGALSTIADDLDALYYNPAGIGATGTDKNDKSGSSSSVYFPYVGGSINANATSTQQQFNATGAQKNASQGQAVIDANAGKRQYARASVMPLGLLFGHVAFVPVADEQLAAVPVGSTSGQVNMRYRSFTGGLIGASVSDNSNRFSLGVSQEVGTIQETQGTFNYTDMVDTTQRNSILAQNQHTYSAKATNVGMTVRVPKALDPTMSIVARNLGNTQNTASASGVPPLVYDEDVTAGFSISPHIGKFAHLNLLVESGYLTQMHLSASKKMRAGAELSFGRNSKKSYFGLRAGGNEAGASYGANLNLGMLGLEAESHAVDIGTNNQRIIERRSSVVASINLATF